MAAQTITGSVIAAVTEKRVDGTSHVVIHITAPLAAYPSERAAGAAPADITHQPPLPTLVGQSIDVTIDDATGVISAIAFTP
jgi:hypothetical protein